MPRTRNWSMLLVAAMILAPAGNFAQEIENDERPDDGFRVLGPRTVVSFVRQTVRPAAGDTTDFPRWTTAVHVSNVGNGPMGAAAIFVSSDASHRAALRFPVAPGQTVSVTVAQIIAAAAASPTDGTDAPTTPPDSLPDEVTGIVILRFFAPTELVAERFFAHMVTAEQFLDLGPGAAPVIVPLDVERPQQQAALTRSTRDRR